MRLIRSGAADYIAKPFDIAALLSRLIAVIRPRADQDMPPETGMSAAARTVDRLASDAATRDRPVLIRGEPGLGKVRLARGIHAQSDRRSAPLVVLDAARGEIADGDLRAAADQAGEGGLVLVGVGSLVPPAQTALMELLQNPAFRLIATAGLQAEEPPSAQVLRPDLLGLLKSHEIVVPALADRPEDAVWLAGRLFSGFNARRKVPLSGFAATAEEAIRAHGWPGNGRELRARVLRAVEAAEGDMVLGSDLFPERAAGEMIRPLADVRDAAERAQIATALERTHGQVAEAARLLRVSRTTLWEKMQKLSL